MDKFKQSIFSLFKMSVFIHNLNKKSEKKFGISLMQWCLLKHLVDMPASSAHVLSKAMGVHPSTLTQTLKRLERKKYVFITEDPKDSRKKIISITRLGNDVLQTSGKKMLVWANNFSKVSTSMNKVSSFLQTQMLMQDKDLL